MFWIWMIVNAAMCASWHTNSDMSGIDCVVALRLARSGSLHVNGVVDVWVLCASVGAAGLDQHLANVFVSQTVEYWVQQRATRRWHQGGIGVQRRAGRVSQQPPEGEGHPAAHKHTEDQDQPREAPPAAVFACI